MFSSKKWKEISDWLINNQQNLTDKEKKYWIAFLSEQNEILLDVWSEQLELLDEVKDNLLSSESLTFKKEQENVEGISFFHLGLYSKAIDSLSNEVDNTEHPSRIYLYLGFSYMYLNKNDKAKEHLLNVIYRSDDQLEKHFAFLGLGIQAGRDNDIEQAISYFEKAEELLFNGDVVYNLGICYLLLEMPKEAIAFFNKVIGSGEGDGEAYYWLGKCYMDTGNTTMAMETWYQAVHEFDNKEILLSLASEFEEEGFFSCALYCYERLYELGMEERLALHGLAWNYGLLDQRDKSINRFEQLLEDSPEDINVWISYVWLLKQWDEKEKLDTCLKKISQLEIQHPLLKKITS
ncbi:tetratricopeptide repeat protein [Evansella cellulosilytica]|uniref:Tetratricopeptide TPR_1 repeat-containing protein n=1 Tax=Evansella cellulosilytica (strain ATCC 21833 / DSM 2522 / FERM P-1141 / JCM 9156 / N-4) TaxID=649639 RepID=E6TZJ4_EVAC2|nr:tetratricopeptide repeat protein [Evansella cellulosilytica]ADU30168.1 Tetratricopeptide TPR_1 repeat-containing protein [Evansella cellulosilytica DSM 2522]